MESQRVIINPNVAHPEWLHYQDSLSSKIRTLQLIQEGRWPKKIEGAAVVTTARWLLRCVYGSDLDAAIALRDLAIQDVVDQQKWEAAIGKTEVA